MDGCLTSAVIATDLMSIGHGWSGSDAAGVPNATVGVVGLSSVCVYVASTSTVCMCAAVLRELVEGLIANHGG